MADLRRLSVDAAHPPTRVRFLALYEIGTGHMNATQWAAAMQHGRPLLCPNKSVKSQRRPVIWLGPFPSSTMLIMDGASCHTAKVVQTTAAALGFTLLPLPGYSPDLDPIEGLWKWMREEVTHNLFLSMRKYHSC